MANDKPKISAIACFCKYFEFCAVQISRLFLRENRNASRPSEHLFPHRGKKVPDGSNIGSTI